MGPQDLVNTWGEFWGPYKRPYKWVYLGLSPLPVTVEMKVYSDSLLKMVHNPGGDWNPGWGVVPR